MRLIGDITIVSGDDRITQGDLEAAAVKWPEPVCPWIDTDMWANQDALLALLTQQCPIAITNTSKLPLVLAASFRRYPASAQSGSTNFAYFGLRLTPSHRHLRVLHDGDTPPPPGLPVTREMEELDLDRFRVEIDLHPQSGTIHRGAQPPLSYYSQ